MHIIEVFNQSQWREAVDELSNKIESISKMYMGLGYTMSLVEETRDKEKDILNADKHIEVSVIGNETAIYKPDVNLLLRFWHDIIHKELDEGFNKESEIIVIEHQLSQLKLLGTSTLAMKIFNADMVGQVLYYDKWKQFVRNQDNFVQHAVRHGINNTIKVRL